MGFEVRVRQKILEFQTRLETAVTQKPENKTQVVGTEVFSKVKETFTQEAGQFFAKLADRTRESALGKKILLPNKKEPSNASFKDLSAERMKAKVMEDLAHVEGPHTAAEVKAAVNQEIKELYKTYPHLDKDYKPQRGEKLLYITPKVQEKLMMLRSLDAWIDKAPQQVNAEILKNKNEPMFKMFGSVEFLGMHAVIEQNIEKGGGKEKLSINELQLTQLERVAVFAYTTGKYNDLNPALRGAQGKELKDSGLADLQKHLDHALETLPPFKASEQVPVLKRAISVSDGVVKFVRRIFGKKQTQDFAYYSTSLDSKISGNINVTILPAAGTQVFNHGHEIPKFLTAWGEEKEVLFKRGIKFEVESRTKNPDGLSWDVTLRCPA